MASSRFKMQYDVSVRVSTKDDVTGDDVVSERDFSEVVVEGGDLQDQVRDVVKTFTRTINNATLDVADQIRERMQGTQLSLWQ